jgi:hypothetical protein
MIGCLCHEVEHRLFYANDTVSFKLASRIDTNNERLVAWLLLVAQLHIEEAKFVSLGFRFATFE